MSRMTCGECRALLHLRMDGPIDPAREAELDEHLSRCSACRATREELLRLREELRSLPGLELPGERLDAVLEATVGARVSARRSRRGRGTRGAGRTALVAASVAAAVVILAIVSGPRGPATPGPSAEEIAELKRALGLAGRSLAIARERGVARVVDEEVGDRIARVETATRERVIEDELVPTLTRIPIISDPLREDSTEKRP